VRQNDLDATVQCGVTRKALNAALNGTGLFFPIDPGADASLGGMAATRASGTNAVRYGTMRENVLGMTVVLPDGRILKTGGRARKSAAGYDLTRLMVGSEGTLGIITELTVRLYPLPEAISSAVCAFPTLDAAVQTVIQTIQLGVPVARIELLDALAITAINRHSKTSLREEPTLFFEFHGSPTGVKEQAETVQEIASDHGGQDFEWATRPEDRSRLWQARHDAYYASIGLKPGCRALTTDVCVPISSLAECIAATYLDLDASTSSSPRWSAMSATATSIWCCWSIPATTRSSPAPRASPRAWRSAPSAWAAPAPANMASASASRLTWPSNTATSRST
jgi:D-lactate dehydrogenase (cytochrome)